MKYKVSIIMPCFNAELFVGDAILSVINQQYTDWELIVVDDCSTDNTLSILNQFSANDVRIKVCSLTNNVGAAKARNIGIELAKGQFLCFLDADDFWFSNFLIVMIDFMLRNKHAIVYSELYWFNNRTGVKTRLILPDVLTRKNLVQTCSISLPALMLDRSKVKDIVFPLVHAEDYALWLQLTKHHHIYCIHEPLVQINRLEHSLSSNKYKAMQWHWLVLKGFTHISLLGRSLLFLVYALNAILKKKCTVYKPVFLPERIINLFYKD